MPSEFRELAPDPGVTLSLWNGLPVGIFIWLAARERTLDRDLRRRAAATSAVLAVLWFGIGLAARVDPQSKDLFVYFGLGVNACVLVDFFARLARSAWTFKYLVLSAAAVGLALIPVMHEWPSRTGVWPDDLRALLDGMKASKWLPWCTRSLFGVALAAMATSASSATALAVLACKPPIEGSLPTSTRVSAGVGFVGSAVLLGIYLIAS